MSYRAIVCTDVHLGERIVLVECSGAIHFAVYGSAGAGDPRKFIRLDVAALRALGAALENNASIGRVELTEQLYVMTIPREDASQLLAIVSKAKPKLVHASCLSRENRRDLQRGIVHARAMLADETLLEEGARDIADLVKEMA